MNINPMRDSHQSTWLPQSTRPSQSIHRLDEGASLRIAPAGQARRLRALRGLVWITADGRPDAPSGDIWLMPGDEWLLPAGADAVLEGWPRASVEEMTLPTASTRPFAIEALRMLGAAIAGRLGLEVRRGARLVGIEGPVRLDRRATRLKGRRQPGTDWGGLYNAGVPRREA